MIEILSSVRAAIAVIAVLCCAVSVRAADTAEILVQVSLTAGLRYHDAKAVWDELQVGDRLALVREPDNPYDANAVRVEWNGHKLGYIPRTENQAVARQIDRGNPLQARITKLTYYRNHRRKLELEVFLPL
jgi:HIRAN domain-containing protein